MLSHWYLGYVAVFSVSIGIFSDKKPARPSLVILTSEITMDVDTAVVTHNLPLKITAKHYYDDDTKFHEGLLDSLRIQLHNQDTNVTTLLTFVFGDSTQSLNLKMPTEEGVYDAKVFAYKDGVVSLASFARYYRIDGLIKEDLFIILEL